MSYKEQAESLGIKVDGRWSEGRVKAEIEKTEKGGSFLSIDKMNDLANRIFDGQGSIPDVERVRRIVNALKDKGYSPEEISQLDIPIDNLSKYLG